MTASLDGLIELKPLVVNFQAEALPGTEKMLLPAMELRAGASDREDAVRVAAERMATMGDDDFVVRMDQDPGFQIAVLEVARYACAINPFSGARNPGCAGVREVARRQTAFRKKQQEAAMVSSPDGRVVSESRNPEDWLVRLRERSE